MTVLAPDAAVTSSGSHDEAGREGGPALRKGITGKLLFFFVLGDVLGAGIYALVGEIAGEVGGAVWVPMLVALGLALLTAGSYAELVTKYPKAGGSAVFAEKAYRSDLVAFLVGYCMLAAGVVSAAGLSIAFSGDYLKTFIDVPTQVGAVVFLLAIAALNARGIRESMGANVVMTCIELTGLLIVIAAAATLLSDGGGEPGRVLEFTENETMLSATFAGTLLAFYSFVGFETTANVAEEIKDPSRVYPRALFGALIAAGIMYALIGMAATSSLPVPDLAESTGPLLSVVDVSPLNVPDRLFSLIALVAVANGALLTMIMSSRLTYGMSVQGNLPRVFSRVLTVRRTPIVAIAVTTAVAIGLTFLGDLATLAETVVLLLLFVFLSTNVAVLVLKKDEVEHEHFRVWSFVPVLATLSCLVLLTQQSGGVWIRGLALVAVGALLFAVMKWRGTGRVETG
jgi:amino acid transporter